MKPLSCLFKLSLSLLLMGIALSAHAEGVNRQKSRIAAPEQPRLPWQAPALEQVKLHNFELGMFAGYGVGSSFECANEKCKKFEDNELDGFLWGGYANYMVRPNSQFTAGVEIDAMRLHAESAVAEWLMSLRARGGYYVTPNLMAYGTGGVAMESEKQSLGWVGGAGLETNPTGNTTVRVEYLHYEFDAQNVDASVDVVKASLGWKF
jgi:opacity protein-like surface antigen